MKHTCDIDRCWKVIGGKLVNVCRKCPTGAMAAVLGRVPRVHAKKYPRMTAREKACAGHFIAEEMDALKQGRWKSRAQAVAVGLSRARTKC